jgi:hypothetical protein
LPHTGQYTDLHLIALSPIIVSPSGDQLVGFESLLIREKSPLSFSIWQPEQTHTFRLMVSLSGMVAGFFPQNLQSLIFDFAIFFLASVDKGTGGFGTLLDYHVLLCISFV